MHGIHIIANVTNCNKYCRLVKLKNPNNMYIRWLCKVTAQVLQYSLTKQCKTDIYLDDKVSFILEIIVYYMIRRLFNRSLFVYAGMYLKYVKELLYKRCFKSSRTILLSFRCLK